MAYTVTPADLESVTDLELAFSTVRFLPKWEDIPLEFRHGNIYTKLAEAIFYDRSLPDGQIDMKPGFKPESLSRAVRAHLKSFSPKHEHKVAGVGFLISQAATLQ